MTNEISVVVVDDSAFIRMLLTQILDSDDQIKVVATAEDPFDAREKIKKYSPDVITLDVEMPKMDGITFLRNLMRLRPMPVIMVSTLTHAGADTTLQALEAGAFDFVAKPLAEVKEKLMGMAGELIEKVKAAAACNTSALDKESAGETEKLRLSKNNDSVDLIAIGASTGGTEAIQSVIKCLPTNLPPIVMTQHIPDVFSTSYAKRLNGEVEMHVMEVREPQKLEPGRGYLAPGHMHMRVKRKRNGELWAYLTDEAPVNRHKPAVDVLFNSVAEVVGDRCIAIILTGMGQDGAKGLLNLKQKGAFTIAQDEQSSVVWGMPGTAVKMNAANKVLSLKEVPKYLVKKLS